MRPLRALAMLLSARVDRVPPPVPFGTTVLRDLAYGFDPAQRLDVYLPAARPAGPILVMVHGGAWALGDKASTAVVANKLAHWLPAGVIFVAVNYRLLPQAAPLEQAFDVAGALAFVQDRAASWGGQASQVVLMGHSTGAHLAALLSADGELAARAGARPWLATVLLDSAALNVVQLMQGPHRRLYDRAFGEGHASWVQASPLHRLQKPPMPMLLVHSSERADVQQQVGQFAAAVQAKGGRAELLSVPLTHLECNAALGANIPYTDRVDAFLRSVGWP